MRRVFFIFGLIFCVNWVNAMDLDFVTSTGEACKRYGMQVKSGEVSEGSMITPLAAVKRRSTFTESDAITAIKNLSLAAYYVPTERTDFQAICGEALLYVASFIKGDGSPNFKILCALYKSQVNESEAAFNETARSEIIGSMLGRFESLVNGDVDKAAHMKSVFVELLRRDRRFSVYSY